MEEHISNAKIGLRGYDVFRSDRNNGRLGGGVMLYVKSDLQSVEFWPNTQFHEQILCVIIIIIIIKNVKIRVTLS